jgi:hypothetical protein
MSTVTDDPTVAEVRASRQQISAAAGHDPKKLVEHYRQLQEQYRGRIVSATPVQPNGDVRRKSV